MAAGAPLVFSLLLFFPLVKGSDHTSITNGIVHLTTVDGDLFVVNQAILYDSDLIKQEIYNDYAGNNMKLQNTTSMALRKLIHYVQNYNQTEFVVSEREDDLSENWQVLFELLLAANELKMKSVSDMAAGIIGNMMRGKSGVEIRRMFNCGDEIAEMKGGEEEMSLESLLFEESMEEVAMGKLVPIN